MRDVIQDNQRARAIAEQELGVFFREPFTGLLLVDGEELIGVCLFDHYRPYYRDIEFTCVLFKPDVGMRIARRVAWYVFKNLGCHRCTAVTRRSNTRACTALESLGFHIEGYFREYYPDNEDGIIYGLLKGEQKILRGLR